MMRLPAFTYLAPRTVEDAVRALADAGPDGMLVAGGTDLYPNMKRRSSSRRRWSAPRDQDAARGWRYDARGRGAGACATLSSMPPLRSPFAMRRVLRRARPALCNMRTIGGNLYVVCAACNRPRWSRSFAGKVAASAPGRAVWPAPLGGAVMMPPRALGGGHVSGWSV
jgi:CO/xanthine dehydrogenase FAD-binding subunit